MRYAIIKTEKVYKEIYSEDAIRNGYRNETVEIKTIEEFVSEHQLKKRIKQIEGRIFGDSVDYRVIRFEELKPTVKTTIEVSLDVRK